MVAVGPAGGHHAPFGIADPQVEIDGIGRQDHPKPLRRVPERRFVRRLQAVDHGAVRGPPAHVAGPLEEVSVDQLDGVQRQVDQALAGQVIDDLTADGLEQAGLLRQFLDQTVGDLGYFRGHALDLAGDDREATSQFADPSALDQGVECQDPGAASDRLDVGDLLPADPSDFLAEADDLLRVRRGALARPALFRLNIFRHRTEVHRGLWNW